MLCGVVAFTSMPERGGFPNACPSLCFAAKARLGSILHAQMLTSRPSSFSSAPVRLGEGFPTGGGPDAPCCVTPEKKKCEGHELVS